jgi:hypothetical protein
MYVMLTLIVLCVLLLSLTGRLSGAA